MVVFRVLSLLTTIAVVYLFALNIRIAGRLVAAGVSLLLEPPRGGDVPSVLGTSLPCLGRSFPHPRRSGRESGSPSPRTECSTVVQCALFKEGTYVNVLIHLTRAHGRVVEAKNLSRENKPQSY